MKKIITILFFSLLISNTCYSQSGWFWQNPLPQGNHLYSANCINANLLFAFGDAGTFIKSTNGGLNWSGNFYIGGIINEGYYRYPKAVNSSFFINAYTGFIGTSSWEYNGYPNINSIFRTSNAGITWDSVTASIYPSFRAFFFINDYTGWSCCSFAQLSSYNYVLKTTNGGFNWINLNSSIKSINSIFFVNPNTGWFVGSYRYQTPSLYIAYYIHKTTDGGQSFITQLYNNQVSQTLKTVYFIDENTGWAGGTLLWKTTDSGNSWNSQSITANCIYFANTLTGYIVNDYGILKTTDSGQNWLQQSDIGGNYLAGSDANNVFLAGNYGSLAKTSNGGVNWLQLTTSVTNDDVLKRVFFVNNITGYIADDLGTTVNSGKIIKTTNSGINWSIIYRFPYNRIYDLFFSNPNTGWATGNLNVFKTINGGINWEIQLGTSYKLDKLYFLNQNTGWASSNIALYYTSNAGYNWLNICNPFYKVDYIHFFNTNIGIIDAGFYGLRRTTDGGVSWQQVLNVSPWCIDADNSENLILYTPDSFYKSTDMGLTWNLISSPSHMPIFTLDMITPSTGYAGGLGGWLVKTTNGGVNWNRQNSKYSGEIWSIHFINETTGWAVGDNGAILSTINGGGNFVGVNISSTEIPSFPSFCQNYPNPFNPVTRIKYDVPKSSLVKIIIFDVLGREIETLLNESQKPGSYEVTWDGSRYASGVYFYKLITDEYVETKKMVLIK